MLQLVPPVCRDCGKTASEAPLAPYLDFLLCRPCALARDRALLAPEKPRPAPPPESPPSAQKRPAKKAAAPKKKKAVSTPAKKGSRPAARKAKPKKGR